MCGVYTIRYNNNVYVGCTKRPFEQRFMEHRYDLRSGRPCNPGLANIVSARGEDVLVFKPVIYCSEQDDIFALEERTFLRYKRAGYKMLNSVNIMGSVSKCGRNRAFDDEEITQLWEQCGSVAGIARATGRGEGTVRVALRRIGYESHLPAYDLGSGPTQVAVRKHIQKCGGEATAASIMTAVPTAKLYRLVQKGVLSRVRRATYTSAI